MEKNSTERAKERAAMQLAKTFGAAPVARVRLCICGYAEVGKTTLVRQLQGRQDQPLERTMGIEVTNVCNCRAGRISRWNVQWASK